MQHAAYLRHACRSIPSCAGEAALTLKMPAIEWPCVEVSQKAETRRGGGERRGHVPRRTRSICFEYGRRAGRAHCVIGPACSQSMCGEGPAAPDGPPERGCSPLSCFLWRCRLATALEQTLQDSAIRQAEAPANKLRSRQQTPVAEPQQQAAHHSNSWPCRLQSP